VNRAEFDALRQTVKQCCDSLDIQFKRIAQLQAELDHVRAAWLKQKPPNQR